MVKDNKESAPKELQQKSVEDVIKELSTNPDGLERYGENALEEEKKNPILEFFSHFWGPIP